MSNQNGNLMNNQTTTRAQRRASRRAELEKQIADKLKHTGHAQFVSEKKLPLSRMATKAVEHGSMFDFMSVKEAWLMHLAHHLMSDVTHIVPPGISLNSASEVTEEMRYLGFRQDENLVPDRITSGGLAAVPQRPFQCSKEMNYVPTQGRVFANVSMSGDKRMCIWFDPFDAENPLKVNTQGSSGSRPSTLGSLRGNTANFPGDVASGATSATFPWSVGHDPRLIPTEYVNVNGPVFSSGPSGFSRAVTLYPHDNYYENAGDQLAPTLNSATNYLKWVCDSKLTVSVSTPTAFTATAMRVRTRDSTIHRVSERIETPMSGDYGLTCPFVHSELSEAAWKGSSWINPTVYREVDKEYGITTDILLVGTDLGLYDARGVSNYHSLNRCLAEMVPVIEVEQATDNIDREVNYSIELIVNMALVPVSTQTTSVSNEYLTFPSSLPHWYQPLCYAGSVHPATNSAATAGLSFVRPLRRQLEDNAVTAIRRDTGSHPHVQAIAAAPRKTILDTLGKVGGQLNGELHKVAQVANEGWNMGKTLWDMGKKIYRFVRPAIQAAESIGPMLLPL
jgi:hypothetical protein